MLVLLDSSDSAVVASNLEALSYLIDPETDEEAVNIAVEAGLKLSELLSTLSDEDVSALETVATLLSRLSADGATKVRQSSNPGH